MHPFPKYRISKLCTPSQSIVFLSYSPLEVYTSYAPLEVYTSYAPLPSQSIVFYYHTVIPPRMIFGLG